MKLGRPRRIVNLLKVFFGRLIGVNDHPGPRSGWLEFFRHRREKTGARSAPIVAGGTGCEAPGLENPIKKCVTLTDIKKIRA
jgi:hypothetical protein